MIELVSCSSDTTIRIWDLNSSECLKILRAHIDRVISIAVILDKQIISGSFYDIKIWDIESATCLQILNIGHTGIICSIVKISNEKIACCDLNGKIIIWKIENG